MLNIKFGEIVENLSRTLLSILKQRLQTSGNIFKKLKCYQRIKLWVNPDQATFQFIFPKNRGSSAAHTGPTVTDRPLCSAKVSRIGAAKPGRKRVDSGAI